MKLYLLFLLFALSACTQSVTSRLAESTDWIILEDTGEQTNCNASANYEIDTTHLDFWPIKYVRLGLHVMDRTSRPFSFDTINGPDQLKTLIKMSNDILAKRQHLLLPKDNNYPALTTRMRYEISPDVDPTKDGIYFHYDEEMPYHMHNGKFQNRGDGKIFNKYKYRNDSILNVFFIAHHPDSVASKTYGTGNAGVAFGSRYLKMVGHWHDFQKPWEVRKTLLHEISHIYKLNHSWIKNDGCDDTPVHKNCWNYNSPAGCTEVSNNIMDYSALSIAFSPCQVGRMHAAMSREKSKARAYVKPNWCEGTNQHAELQDSFVLRRETDLEGDLTLLPGSYLEVRCRLSIPKGHRITVLPGATLALAGGRIHNSCGFKWEGIFVERTKRRHGNLILMGGGSIEDALGGSILPDLLPSTN